MKFSKLVAALVLSVFTIGHSFAATWDTVLQAVGNGLPQIHHFTITGDLGDWPLGQQIRLRGSTTQIFADGSAPLAASSPEDVADNTSAGVRLDWFILLFNETSCIDSFGFHGYTLLGGITGEFVTRVNNEGWGGGICIAL